MKPFMHLTAQSLEEATALLEQAGGKARIIAGGTDLLGEMKDAILPEGSYPKTLVNIKAIPGLDYIAADARGLRVGALTRLEDLATDEVVMRDYPALAEAARKTASPHIREMGTLAGNICQNNRCWYYWVPDNAFNCLRKGGNACYALPGDSRYHSIYGAVRVGETACTRGCPNDIDIPSYLAEIRQGDMVAAAMIVLQKNPLPAVTGRVCPHTCETECARGEFDEAISIREIERFMGDYILENVDLFYEAPVQESGKRVAVLGAGPAGLSAAFYLRRAGHDVTVFERLPEAGGMLRYGIPPYRLPREVLAKQIGGYEKLGIRFVLGASVDTARFAEIAGDFDAVFVACGAWQQTDAGISGEECLPSGVQFLSGANLEQMRGKTVGVIGGGNTAIDVARSLLRVGASPIIFYRRTKDEMPALRDEVERAEEEGVRFSFLTLPVGAEEEEGGVSLTCCRMELGDVDSSGRPRPVRVEGSEFEERCDLVVKAIVERPDYSFLPADLLDERGRLLVEETTKALGNGVFAGGDFVTGPATVAQATCAGRDGAESIDRYLRGVSQADEPAAPVCSIGDAFRGSCLQLSTRVNVPEKSLEERLSALDVEETGTVEQASVAEEAGRCFNCGCVAVNSSDLAPALVALGAEVRTSKRAVAAEDFFAVARDSSTVLADGEMVIEVDVPKAPPGTSSAFIKFALRKSIDFPVVNCAAMVTSEGGVVKSARICLNSVYGVPMRVTAAEEYLAGKRLDLAAAERAADLAVSDTVPLLTNRYKIPIARALVKRALLACMPEAEAAKA
jgi:NADPH-dependent glutamate synthase beta subunit-like oxidoreductase/CO/xanthine dehydrogenase FAD-binding subunit